MKKFKIIYMDGYDEVRDADTHDIIFSTKIPEDLVGDIGRGAMIPSVIDNVVNIWNKGGDVDDYLLNSVECYQEEREIITESLFDYGNK